MLRVQRTIENAIKVRRNTKSEPQSLASMGMPIKEVIKTSSWQIYTFAIYILFADNSECRRSARAIARKDTRSSRSFSELPPAAQKIATNISAMGFPIDRVARIAAKIGDDEKKVGRSKISICIAANFSFVMSSSVSDYRAFDIDWGATGFGFR